MSLERTLQIVQVAYPQVYLACHTRHQRKRSTAYQLSARDAAILAHLDKQSPTTPARLASHLNVTRSTLSEALKRLTALGYTRQTPRPPVKGRRGGVGVLLTAAGMAAIRETSVLETPRLRALLGLLTPTELVAVARGMSALAAACNRRAAVMLTSTNLRR
jgi:MarR family transcriptional regulator, organic hydroperoxide resistance regulator